MLRGGRRRGAVVKGGENARGMKEEEIEAGQTKGGEEQGNHCL